MKPIIETRDLTKVYRAGKIQVPALRNVSVTIEQGEYVAIMGASGSGKSTLMNILGCLDRPTEGKYLLDGIDVSELTDNELADIRSTKIGFVFQSYNLLAKTTALENVELPMVYSRAKNRRDKAMECLDLVGLADRVKHKPNELSGGQQQRVAIARALANEPAMILADEPTGNLDSKSSAEIMELFTRMNDKGRTIVLVTHEEEIAHCTKRILRLYDGRLVKDEKVKDRITSFDGTTFAIQFSPDKRGLNGG